MSRKYFVGGNFKMNPISQEQKNSLVTALNAADLDSEAEVVIAPPSLYLIPVKSLVRRDIQVAAQNCYFKSEGAYTGEISPAQLRDAGIEYVILGHSERRTLFHETNSDVAQKTKAALQHSLKVILCVGETEKEYDNHQTKDVVEGQLQVVIQVLDEKDWSSIVIAYEPVWAIGTGKTATPAVAQGVHEIIRQYLAKGVSAQVAAGTRIIYGGSVKAGNCKDLAAQSDIDGFLVGGESLKPGFVDIVNARRK
ncbi:Triosephosphate isomerase [Phlebopus sp. FC_14]|nr:Triosephosphate isomerase [Phlebopus sp. FC_14]